MVAVMTGEGWVVAVATGEGWVVAAVQISGWVMTGTVRKVSGEVVATVEAFVYLVVVVVMGEG